MTGVSRDLLSGAASQVAPALLGARLESGRGADLVAVELTEVEAYEGLDDPASHAYRGPTPRTAVMFGPAGHLYVYFVYGMHWCANIVCGPDGEAAAVLLRAGRVVAGQDVARARRPAARFDAELGRGPARLTQCLGLTGTDTGTDLLRPGAPVRLTSLRTDEPAIAVGPRVGVAAAHEAELRFWIDGDRSVSPYRRGSRQSSRRGRQT
ncbi:MAG: DNA-3-methyladenine glycosylase [Jatrophihabitans sp.]